MNIEQQIELAFEPRRRPELVVDPAMPECCERSDASWFAGKDRHDVAWLDFGTHGDAVFGFSPEAFKYFLPRVMQLAVASPEEWFAAADAILQVLDRGLTPTPLDEFIATRFGGLASSEFAAILEWLLALDGLPQYGDDERLLRCIRTIDQLEDEMILGKSR